MTAEGRNARIRYVQASTLDLREFVDGMGGTTSYTADDLTRPVPLLLRADVFHVANAFGLGEQALSMSVVIIVHGDC